MIRVWRLRHDARRGEEGKEAWKLNGLSVIQKDLLLVRKFCSFSISRFCLTEVLSTLGHSSPSLPLFRFVCNLIAVNSYFSTIFHFSYSFLMISYVLLAHFHFGTLIQCFQWAQRSMKRVCVIGAWGPFVQSHRNYIN